jgi:hypothetical protein
VVWTFNESRVELSSLAANTQGTAASNFMAKLGVIR